MSLFHRSDGPATLAQGPKVGSVAPDVEGDDFAGQRFKLSDYRGKVVVISFWASNCLPCRKLIPHEQAIVERYRNKNFALIGVNLDTERNAALKAMATCGVSWRNWQGGGDSVKNLWHVEFIPAIYVIDAKGVVRATLASGDGLENVIDTLLAESAAKR